VRRVVLALLAAASLVYPFAVYVGLQTLPPTALGAALLAVVAARLLLLRRRSSPFALAALIAAAALLGFLFLAPDAGVRAWPALLSAALGTVFAWSLRHPPSAIERIARLREPALRPEGVAYTRKVTIAWMIFFFANAAIAAWTAIWASLETWTLYNGLISYLLIALFFAIEFTIRQRLRRRFA
jgi:uncharacterized membrane protein